MENNKRVYGQSIDSIIRDHEAREGIRNDSYDFRMRRGEINRVRRIGEEVLAEQKRNRRKNIIGKLKILVPISFIVALSIGGYNLIKNLFGSKDILKVYNFVPTSRRDLSIYFNKDKAGTTIEKLLENDYESVTEDEVKYACDYIFDAELGNYDYNGSTIFFNLSDYFDFKVYFNKGRFYQEQSDLIKELDQLYRNCFVIVGDTPFIDDAAAKLYLDKLLSACFMYDTTFSGKESNFVNTTQKPDLSIYAKEHEIYAFNGLPQILKYLFANQGVMLLKHVNYTPNPAPSNYGNGQPSLLEKVNLIDRLQQEMSDYRKNMISYVNTSNIKK